MPVAIYCKGWGLGLNVNKHSSEFKIDHWATCKIGPLSLKHSGRSREIIRNNKSGSGIEISGFLAALVLQTYLCLARLRQSRLPAAASVHGQRKVDLGCWREEVDSPLKKLRLACADFWDTHGCPSLRVPVFVPGWAQDATSDKGLVLVCVTEGDAANTPRPMISHLHSLNIYYLEWLQGEECAWRLATNTKTFFCKLQRTRILPAIWRNKHNLPFFSCLHYNYF